jgi:putative membrane protein
LLIKIEKNREEKMGHDMGWGFMGFGWILWVIIFVVIIWVAIKIANVNQNRKFDSPQESPLDILKKRYARGEISKEQHEQIKKDLQ